MRIGHGYDVHRLVPQRKLIIGGVEVPHETGLLGHSDADVLTHAVIDALLGAAALGDIGAMFPDSDQNFKDANSIELLKIAVDKLRKLGYAICNIDCTIVAQRPKLAGFVPAMRVNIAKNCGVQVCDINVKATTEEGLGFTGREEGIAAHAVCIIERRT